MTTHHHRHRMGRDIPDTEVDARLAEHRCVWCGDDIPADAAAEDLFDRESCQKEWRRATVADYTSGGVPVERVANWDGPRDGGPPTWLGPQPGIDYTPDTTPIDVDLSTIPEPEPTPVPALQLDHQPAGAYANRQPGALDALNLRQRLGRLADAFRGRTEHLGGLVTTDGHQVFDGPELPPYLDYAPPPGVDHRRRPIDMAYGVRVLDPPTIGRVANPDPHLQPVLISQHTGRRTTQGTEVGGPTVYGLPILQDAEPPAEPRSGWPMRNLARMLDQGHRLFLPRGPELRDRAEFTARWHTAHAQDNVLLPYRICARCGATALPVPITARWPHATRHEDADGGAVGYEVDPVTMTKLCCGECLLPYPGPTLVPLVRAPGTVTSTNGTARTRTWYWEYTLLSTTAYMTRQVSEMAQERVNAGVDVGGLTWGDLHRGVLQEGTPHQCCIPGCDTPAHAWMLLGGALSWQGWIWRVEDGIPLHMGLCGAHHARMIMDLRAYEFERAHWRGLVSSQPGAPFYVG